MKSSPNCEDDHKLNNFGIMASQYLHLEQHDVKTQFCMATLMKTSTWHNLKVLRLLKKPSVQIEERSVWIKESYNALIHKVL